MYQRSKLTTRSPSASNAVLHAGLGVVQQAFEPRLQTDRRWGRLYGISESSGIVLLDVYQAGEVIGGR